MNVNYSGLLLDCQIDLQRRKILVPAAFLASVLLALLVPNEILAQQLDVDTGSSLDIADEAYCNDHRKLLVNAAIAFAAAAEIIPLDNFGPGLGEGEAVDFGHGAISMASGGGLGFGSCPGDIMSMQMYLLQRFCGYVVSDFLDVFEDECGYSEAHAIIWVGQFLQFGSVGPAWW